MASYFDVEFKRDNNKFVIEDFSANGDLSGKEVTKNDITFNLAENGNIIVESDNSDGNSSEIKDKAFKLIAKNIEKYFVINSANGLSKDQVTILPIDSIKPSAIFKSRYHLMYFTIKDGVIIGLVEDFKKEHNDYVDNPAFSVVRMLVSDIGENTDFIADQLIKAQEIIQSADGKIEYVYPRAVADRISMIPARIKQMLESVSNSLGGRYEPDSNDMLEFVIRVDFEKYSIQEIYYFREARKPTGFFLSGNPQYVNPVSLYGTAGFNKFVSSEPVSDIQIRMVYFISSQEPYFKKPVKPVTAVELLETTFGRYNKETLPTGIEITGLGQKFETLKKESEVVKEQSTIREVLKVARKNLIHQGGLTYDFNLDFNFVDFNRRLKKAKTAKEQIDITVKEFTKYGWEGLTGLAVACLISKIPLEELLSRLCTKILDTFCIDEESAKKIVDVLTLEELKNISGDLYTAWADAKIKHPYLTYLPNYQDDLDKAGDEVNTVRELYQQILFKSGKYGVEGFDIDVNALLRQATSREKLCLLLAAIIAAMILCLVDAASPEPKFCKLPKIVLPEIPEFTISDILAMIDAQVERLIRELIANLLTEMMRKIVESINQFCNDKWSLEDDEPTENKPRTKQEIDDLKLSLGDNLGINTEDTEKYLQMISDFLTDLSSLFDKDRLCAISYGQGKDKEYETINKLIDSKYPDLEILKSPSMLQSFLSSLRDLLGCKDLAPKVSQQTRSFISSLCSANNDPAFNISKANESLFGEDFDEAVDKDKQLRSNTLMGLVKPFMTKGITIDDNVNPFKGPMGLGGTGFNNPELEKSTKQAIQSYTKSLIAVYTSDEKSGLAVISFSEESVAKLKALGGDSAVQEAFSMIFDKIYDESLVKVE